MKKGIFLALVIFSTPLHAFQYREGSNFAFADLLVWKLREGSDDNWSQRITPAGTFRRADLYEVPFSWNSGFRVGFGHEGAHHAWDAALSYTHYETESTDQATTTSGGIYSPYLGNFFINNTNGANFGPNYVGGRIQWNFSFNTVDIELGRPFYIDKTLMLRPFIGLKVAMINQDIKSSWLTPTTATTFTSAVENLTQDFLGVGPSFGFNTTLTIYNAQKHSLNLFGQLSGALQWGHWSFSDLYQNNTPASVQVNFSDIDGVSTMARGLMGLEWNSSILSSDLTIRLGYEAQIWLNQMQYYTLNSGRLDDLMSLQGGVLDFSITPH